MPLEGVFLTLLTLAMALTSRRFIPLFGMSLAIMMAPLVALCFDKLRLQRFAAALALAALVFAGYRLKNGIQGKVYALYNWGGYIHWRMDGRLKVYIDGRADTIYDAQAYYNYIKVLTSRPGWIESIESSGAEYIMWPHINKRGREKLQQLRATGRWKPVYRDAVSWMVVRQSVNSPERFRPSPDSPWRDMSVAQISAWNGQPGTAISYAEKTREVIPWHKGACNLLSGTLRSQEKQDQADTVMEECRAYFPSAYLR
jgi:hypothetical protein